jgi:hypothetical protein
VRKGADLQTFLHSRTSERLGGGSIRFVETWLKDQLQPKSASKGIKREKRTKLKLSTERSSQARSFCALALGCGSLDTYSSVTDLICFAIFMICSSDSITLGPAMRKKGSAPWTEGRVSRLQSGLFQRHLYAGLGLRCQNKCKHYKRQGGNGDSLVLFSFLFCF